MKKYNLFFLAVGVTVVLLFTNVLITQNGMKPLIVEHRLVDEQNIEEGGVSPMVAFTTVALGGFRGLIADILWLRALSLQEQGKYFEMVQLADWIQKLQPKFAGVSSYLGWNMAYNISVTCKDFEDRWRWVNRGIETMVDAVRMNPNDPQVYYQLSWIYYHKLGNTLDEAQQYYKIQLATKMQDMFGNEHYPDWKALAESPENEEGFRELYPQDNYLWTKIKNAGYSNLPELEESFISIRNLPEGLSVALDEKERKDLTNYFRARLLKDKLLLDPDVVVEIEDKYGELDWYLAESLGIYWAYLGVERSPDRQNAECERIIIQALGTSLQNGRMLIAKSGLSSGFIMLVPNFNLYDKMVELYKTTIERNPDVSSFKLAYRMFMSRGVELLYSYGQKERAQEYFDLMKKEKMPEVSGMNLDQFVYKRWEMNMRDSGFKQRMQMISAMITQSTYLLAHGDYEAAESFLALGKMTYDRHMADLGLQERQALKPFEMLRKEIMDNIMTVMDPALAEALKGELTNLGYEQTRQKENAAAGQGAAQN